MQTESPPLSRIATMVLFALSCVGLLLFLWLSFGGTMPFNPQGYRFQVAFPNAFDLADQADVRIAGVSVGKVVAKVRDARDNRTLVTIQLSNQYAPIRRDTSAILREKTLLGETYVQLTPGSPRSPPLPDGGRLANAQVVPAVQLDQIFNTFDPTTRAAFRQWQQEIAKAVTGNDQNLNDTLGNLPPFAINFTQLLQVLDVEHNAVVSLVQNGGTTFAALNRDPAALRTLITAGDTTFGTLARNNTALADIFQIFPTFLTQQRLTMADLQTFSRNADPVIRELIPSAQKLKPTLQAVNQLSPYLRTLFVKLGPLVTVSQTGLPATERVLKGLGPNTMLDQLGPFLEQLNPIFDWIGGHQQLTSDFITNGGGGFFARTTTFGGNGTGHYLRQFGPTGPETLSLAPNRDADNRGNVYPSSTWLGDIFNAGGNYPGDWGLASWDCKNTGGNHPSSRDTSGHPACWTQPPLPGAPQAFKVPPINSATYSSK
jgi:phospholipid/cholesterol/gamma-HCH transport system substrate-binding protein